MNRLLKHHRNFLRTAAVVLSIAMSAIAPGYAQTPSMLDPVATQVAAGALHTCAVTTLGSVECWGYNYYGQTGGVNTGTSNPTTKPVVVGGLTAAASIATGGDFTCALAMTGGVKCWGANYAGQLGNSTNSGNLNPNHFPLDVSGLGSGVAAIAAGGSHACALTTAGGVKCWGSNRYGQLGNSTNTNTANPNPTPADVNGLTSGVAAISSGVDYTCALTTAGGIKCWGYNYFGQLGNSTNTHTTSPNPTATDVTGLTSGVAAITTGDSHTCALTTAGGVKCWGYNRFGQIGTSTNAGTDNANPTPTSVSSLTSGVAAITAGGDSETCALTVTGGIKCWGYNLYGELGNSANVGTSNANATPLDVSGLGNGMSTIAAGGDHVCGMTTTGGVKCWGYNNFGQVGNNINTSTGNPNPAPTDVTSVSSEVTSIVASDEFTCALTAAGGAKCWGANSYGQLGSVINTGTSNPNLNPDDVTNLTSGVAIIVAGQSHACAVTTAGGVKCWGSNQYGQLGNSTNSGTTTPNPGPADVSGLTSGVASIAASYNHTCALTTAGGVKCWGYNASGQLGNSANIGTPNPNPAPSDVSGLTSGVIAITAGNSFTCALTTAASVKCWGNNGYGQLGSGVSTGSNNPTPTVVTGLSSGVTAIAAGSYHACALTAAGGVKCWGDNNHGQLGNSTNTGTSTANPTPTDVSGLSAVAKIAAGGEHTCAVTAAGGIKCWGYNSSGELGDSPNVGTEQPNPTPADISGLASGMTTVVIALRHTCALTATGRVKCLGDNVFGELGTGTTNSNPNTTPLAVLAGDSIAFTPSLRAGAGNSVIMFAKAGGGDFLRFDTWTPSTCAISGNTLTLIQPGLCGVRVARSGITDADGGSIAAAPLQLRLIHVEPDLIFASGFESYAGFNN